MLQAIETHLRKRKQIKKYTSLLFIFILNTVEAVFKKQNKKPEF